MDSDDEERKIPRRKSAQPEQAETFSRIIEENDKHVKKGTGKDYNIYDNASDEDDIGVAERDRNKTKGVKTVKVEKNYSDVFYNNKNGDPRYSEAETNETTDDESYSIKYYKKNNKDEKSVNESVSVSDEEVPCCAPGSDDEEDSEPCCTPGVESAVLWGLKGLIVGANASTVLYQFFAAWLITRILIQKYQEGKPLTPEELQFYSLAVAIVSAVNKGAVMFFLNTPLASLLVPYFNHRQWRLPVKTLGEKLEDVQTQLVNLRAREEYQKMTDAAIIAAEEAKVIREHRRISTHLKEYHSYLRFLLFAGFALFPAYVFSVLNFYINEDFTKTVHAVQPGKEFSWIAERGAIFAMVAAVCTAMTNWLGGFQATEYALQANENTFFDYESIKKGDYKALFRFGFGLVFGLAFWGTTSAAFYFSTMNLVRNHLVPLYLTRDPIARGVIAGLNFAFMVVLAYAITYPTGRQLGHYLFDAPGKLLEYCSGSKEEVQKNCRSLPQDIVNKILWLLAIASVAVAVMPALFQANSAGENTDAKLGVTAVGSGLLELPATQLLITILFWGIWEILKQGANCVTKPCTQVEEIPTREGEDTLLIDKEPAWGKSQSSWSYKNCIPRCLQFCPPKEETDDLGSQRDVERQGQGAGQQYISYSKKRD